MDSRIHNGLEKLSSDIHSEKSSLPPFMIDNYARNFYRVTNFIRYNLYLQIFGNFILNKKFTFNESIWS